MTQGRDMPIDPVEAYLDGALEAQARRDFELRLAQSPELRAEVARHEQISHGLRRLYQPPRIEAPAESAPSSSGRSGFRFPARYLVYAAAAAIAVTAAAVYQFRAPTMPAPTLIEPAPMYQRLVADGFKPSFVCTTDEEFAETVKQRFGQPLLVGTTPSVQLLGWGYGADYEGVTLSRNSLILMALVDGVRTVVLMDNSFKDRELEKPKPESGLNMFKSEVGKIVLYEVSPSTRPAILPLTYNPEVDKSPVQ